MHFWYKFFTYLFYPFSPIYLFFRKLNNKEHPERYKEKMSLIKIKREKGYLIWLHVASVGEAMSILPLIECFEKEKKILTHTEYINKKNFFWVKYWIQSGYIIKIINNGSVLTAYIRTLPI